jgi:hypothetical protein
MQNGTRAKLVGSSGKKRVKIIKAKLMNLKQTISTTEICTDIHEFKNGYQRRTNILLEDKDGDLVAASHSILDMGKK